MGVVVNEMTMETIIAVESVTANSRNRRPTIPAIISRGIKTAMSEMLMETTVNPISCGSLYRRGKRLHPIFEVAGDVLNHDDRIIHDETGHDRQCHERQIVQAISEHIHHGERANERDRHGNSRDERGPGVAQKDKHDDDDQADRNDQRPLNVIHRRANGGCSVQNDRDIDPLWNGCLDHRQLRRGCDRRYR